MLYIQFRHLKGILFWAVGEICITLAIALIWCSPGVSVISHKLRNVAGQMLLISCISSPPLRFQINYWFFSITCIVVSLPRIPVYLPELSLQIQRVDTLLSAPLPFSCIIVPSHGRRLFPCHSFSFHSYPRRLLGVSCRQVQRNPWLWKCVRL